MASIKMKINGKDIVTEEDKTVLQAALAAGIDIPHMCYSEQLKPYGACRLCMVEITKGTRKRLVASCAYPAEEGLVVETDTPKIQKIRKMLVELLWPSAPKLAEQYGITESRFSNDHTDCSLCGLCVRYCTELGDKKALFFKGRGVNREIGIVPELADNCVYCQKCFSFCNGGKLLELAGKPWQ
jgi:bidirectional [NiFe] hydrogenase diaphorase subunit